MKRIKTVLLALGLATLLAVATGCPQPTKPEPPPEKTEKIDPIPQNLKAIKVASDYITLSWDKVKTASAYIIISSPDPTFPESPATKQTELPAEQTSYTHTNLPSSTTYYYKVASKIDEKQSDWSKETSATTTGLNSPSQLTLMNYTTSSVEISWQPVAGAESYEITRSIGRPDDFRKVEAPSNPTTDTQFKDTTVVLSPGVIVYYRVHAIKGQLTSPVSPTVEVMIGENIPNNFKVSYFNNKSITLQWNRVASEHTVFYNIYKAASKNGPYQPLVTGLRATSTYTNQSLQPATRHFYKISTTINGKASNMSLPIEGVTPPLPPNSFWGSNQADNSLVLNWKYEIESQGAGVLGYFVYNVKTSEYSKDTTVDLTNPTIVSAKKDNAEIFTNLTAGTEYSFIVRAYILNSNNDYILSSMPNPPFTDFTKLPKTTPFEEKDTQETAIVLKWKAVELVDGEIIRTYKLERSKTSNFSQVQIIDITTANSTLFNKEITYTDEKLTSFSPYYYRVKAIKAGMSNGKTAEGMESEPLYSHTNLLKPILDTSTVRTDKRVQLTFNKIYGGEEYIVERATDNSFTQNKTTFTVPDDVNLTKMIAIDSDLTQTTPLTPLAPYTQYYYRIKAKHTTDHINKKEVFSDWSEALSVRTKIETPPKPGYSLRGSNYITLTWPSLIAYKGTKKIEIHRAEDINGPYTKLNYNITAGEMIQLDNQTLNHSTLYYYKLMLSDNSNIDNNSDFSEVLTVSTLMSPVENIQIVSNSVKETEATVTWNKHAAATEYVVSVINNQGTTVFNQTVAATTDAAMTLALSTLTVGDKHTVSIIAKNPSTESEAATKEFYTCPGQPEITVVGEADTNKGHLDIKWSMTDKGNQAFIKYIVERVSPAEIVATGITTLYTTDPDTANITPYTYIVKAYIEDPLATATGGRRYSADSTAKSGESGLSTPVLQQPTVGIGSTEVTLKWAAVDGATVYEIWHKIDGDKNYKKVAPKSYNDSTATISATYDVKSTGAGKKNYFYIIAKTDTKSSIKSNTQPIDVK